MPALFSFDTTRRAGVTWHVMKATDTDIPEPRCVDLWEQAYPDEPELHPFWRYGVNNQDGEALAVWRALAWAITDAPLRAVIPRFDRDHVADYLGVARNDVAFIDWEYEVNYESESFDDADKGFMPARSSVPIRPAPTEWERQHISKAGLFRLHGLNELHRVDTGVSFDVASELSLFGLRGTEFSDLQSALSGPNRPALADLLGDTGVMAHQTVVRDRFLGHCSYFGIASNRDVSVRLDELARTFQHRGDRYCTNYRPSGSFQDFVAAMEDLLLPVAAAPNPVLPLP
jgi:hypothetical protein